MELTKILGTNLTVRSGKYTDLSYLKEISEGSSEFMRKMIETFIEETPKLLQAMDICLTEKNWNGLKNIAHKMKPSIDFMGIRSIWEAIKDIEWYAAEKINLNLLPGLVTKIKNVCRYALEELEIELTYFK